MRALLIKLIRITHTLLVLFVLFGWTCPDPVVLKVHLIFIPLMILHWKTNGDMCFLTNLENRLRSENEKKDLEEGDFVKSLILNFTDTLPSEKTMKLCVYGFTWLSWGLSLLRFKGVF